MRHDYLSPENATVPIERTNLKNVQILEGIFPDETSKTIENKSFSLCHIDVDVYKSAKDIVKWVWPRLVDNGIIIFDDYGFQGCEGITAFVNEEINKKDRLVIHNLNGHAIMIKLGNR